MPSYQKNLLLSSLKTALFLLLILTLARVFIYTSFIISDATMSDVFDAFFLGMRLDLSVIAYILIVPLLMIILTHFIRLPRQVFVYYFLCMLVVLSAIVASDVGNYSFFGEHITLAFFGLIDDDTTAIFNMLRANYNIPLILFLMILYITVMYFIINFFFTCKENTTHTKPKIVYLSALYVLLILGVFLMARGSIGMYPVSTMIADVSEDEYINTLPQNGVFALLKASKEYVKNKNNQYDIIKKMGYKGRIKEAFKRLNTTAIDTNNLLKSLDKTTATNAVVKKNPPNVVVVMVESFGLPILDYQSDDFDIMRALKKHFDEDVVFTNFISASNGTIVSLEPLLLNLTARPNSISFGQSQYQKTDFSQASARVYEKAGYETTFVYGGDLSWRNVGHFFKHQGFLHVRGKAAIQHALNLKGDDVFHEWGVYDQFTYAYVEKLLKNASKPQFIFVLTTNNHPPFKLYKKYKSKPLHFDEKILKHLKGDMELNKERLYDYQYALDMGGKFLDSIKASKLKDNTIVAMTADNNTIEGIMKYDDIYNKNKKIPLYLYLPPYLNAPTFDTTLASSHKDIFPTLYNLSLSDVSYRAIGSNLANDSIMHCGFNDAGVIMSKDGGFKLSKAKTKAQKECVELYKASLSAQEYMIKQEYNRTQLAK